MSVNCESAFFFLLWQVELLAENKQSHHTAMPSIMSANLKYKRDEIFSFRRPVVKVCPIEFILRNTSSSQITRHARKYQKRVEVVRNNRNPQPTNQFEHVVWSGNESKQSSSRCNIFVRVNAFVVARAQHSEKIVMIEVTCNPRNEKGSSNTLHRDVVSCSRCFGTVSNQKCHNRVINRNKSRSPTRSTSGIFVQKQYFQASFAEVSGREECRQRRRWNG